MTESSMKQANTPLLQGYSNGKNLDGDGRMT